MKRTGLLFFTAAMLGAAASAAAQTSATDEIAKYREMLADGNPAELWEMRGEELWKTKTGPKNASLERCDLGKGPGVVKGAYAELPRHFNDAGKVMDLEARLVHCRMNLQGLSREDATKIPFGSAGKKSDIEALVSYITSESRGMKMAGRFHHIGKTPRSRRPPYLKWVLMSAA